jgi:hypothetical protein
MNYVKFREQHIEFSTYFREKGNLKSNVVNSIVCSAGTSDASIKKACRTISHMFLVKFSAMCLAIACPT